MQISNTYRSLFANIYNSTLYMSIVRQILPPIREYNNTNNSKVHISDANISQVHNLAVDIKVDIK